MLEDKHVGHGPAFPSPASQAGPEIPDGWRAVRIGDVTHFAECLVETGALCPHRFAFNSFRYCEHPQREVIIGRTLATE